MAKTLETLVSEYGQHDTELKAIKKVCDEEKEQIKTSMGVQGKTKCIAGGFKVTRTVSEKTQIDEARMLEILKADWSSRNGSMQCPYIKRVEVIDYDKLEEALYAQSIPTSVLLDLDACKSVTEVVTLKCTKAKKEDLTDGD